MTATVGGVMSFACMSRLVRLSIGLRVTFSHVVIIKALMEE